MFDLGKFGASIELDSTQFNKGMADAEKKTGGFSGKLGGFAKSVGKVAVGAIAGLGVAFAGAFAAANKVTAGFDNIVKSSYKLGITTDAYQEMDYWASQNGISSGTFERAVGRLNQRIGLAAEGNDKYGGALERLGVNMDDVRDGHVTTEEVMQQSIQALSEIENENEKAALASELFGTKLSRDLMPALQGGSLTMDEAKEAAERLGIVIGEDSLEAGVKFQDNLTDMKASLGAIGQNIMTELLPVFNSMTDWVLENMPAIQSAFSVATDIISRALGLVITAIQDHLIPKIQDLWAWIEPHLPMMQQLFEDAFGLAKEVILETIEVIQDITKKIQEHWAIFEPVLVGIAAGVAVFGLITGAITLWTTVVGIATGVAGAFGAVMAFITSPIGLVVVAIGLVVAAGVALYKNWDTVKEMAIKIWSSVSDFFVKTFDFIVGIFNKALDWIDKTTNGKFKAVTDYIRNYMKMAQDNLKAVWDYIKNTFSNALAFLKALVTLDFQGMRNAMSNQMENARNLISNILGNIKTFFSRTFGDILSNTKSRFNSIKDGIMKPIEDAKNRVSKIIDQIKGFFSGLKLSIPSIKLPKLPRPKITGSFSLTPPRVPKISWNKDGGIFAKPTIFNTANAGLQGVGEAGAEAIIPLRSDVLAGIGKGISQNMHSQPTIIDSGFTINNMEVKIDSVEGGEKGAKSMFKHIERNMIKRGGRK